MLSRERRKRCKSRATAGGDQLVPNRRRRRPLTLPCVCLYTSRRGSSQTQTLLPPLYPFACLCLASSSESSIFLLFTPCIRSSSRHSLDWPELYICLARNNTTPLIGHASFLLTRLIAIAAPPTNNNTPLSLNAYTHTAPVEGKYASSHGKQAVALLHRLWFASQPDQHNAEPDAILRTGLDHNSPERSSQRLLFWPAISSGTQHEFGSQHMGISKPDGR